LKQILSKYCWLLLYWCAILIFSISVCWAQDQKGAVMSPKSKYQNRLIHEKSPYLLQHADNPVDWHPWGEEAFEAAKKQDKPIFLSIGYSTCHWCHVMEHESFEDPKIAEMINENFIPIKVDREERPDIDNIYMSAVMEMTGSGGWPLTVLLTHDKKPFFGGTYFPPTAKWGSPGLTDIIQSVANSWANRRDELIQSSNTLTQLLADKASKDSDNATLSEQTLTLAYQQYDQMYDSRYGGFGHSPKFPTSHNLSFLLRYWKRTSNDSALEIVEHTLTQMARGGMYDHIGGGFHRYSTDQQWQIPHFEKMLYDQAILSRTYLEAYQITKNDFYAQVAREIFDYVLRDMQQEQGGFYSAEDADSLDPDEYKGMTIDPSQAHEKKEGAFFLWRYDEIMDVLGKDDAEIFNYYFDIQLSGNALHDPHNEFVGKNIIYVKRSLEETAGHFKRGVSEVRQSIQNSKAKLLEVRNIRPRPHLDDKVLTDWNGLMISSLSFGSRVLNEEKYKKAAEKAARFIQKELVTPDGRLLHRYRDGDSAIMGTIEDYAFMIHGLLDLYEATFKIEYLKQSIDLANQMVRLFWDDKDGGFYFTADDAERLLYRQKEIYDGAIPSGNSVAALDLVRLSRLTFEKKWEDNLGRLFNTFSAEIANRPSSYGQMLSAFDFALGPSKEIVIAVPSVDRNIDEIINAVYERYIPNKVVLLRPETGAGADEVVSISPFVEYQLPINDQATVYLCENHICKLPVSDLEKFRSLLDGLQK